LSNARQRPATRDSRFDGLLIAFIQDAPCRELLA
jgi:hypothetical protein